MAEERERLKLAPGQAERLRGMEKDIIWLEHELMRATRAGLDVSEQKKKLEETKKLRLGLLNEYS